MCVTMYNCVEARSGHLVSSSAVFHLIFETVFVFIDLGVC